MSNNVAVREYKSNKDFERDASKWVKKGYTVAGIVRKPGHLGTNSRSLNATLAIATGGLGLLIARTGERTTVTYVKVPGR